MNNLKFETLILDMLESKNIRSGEELTEIAIQLHESIESAMYDYSMDHEIFEEYEPSY